MQNSLSIDFNKILDQTLYTYLPEKMSKLEEAKHVEIRKPDYRTNLKLGIINRLRPVVELIGLGEIIVGVILLIFLIMLACDYDKLYATEDSGLMSLMSFGGSVFLVINGIMLLTALKLNNRKVLWFYLIMSTILWIYIFVLAVMKIHFAIHIIERDTLKIIYPETRHYLKSNACVDGVATMLGSVIYFVGNVTVFAFYNLKYLQPILCNCGP